MHQLILFDTNENRGNLLPFTFMRPISEIRCGIMTIREKWEMYSGRPVFCLTVAYLREKFPLQFAANNLFINASVLPEANLFHAIAGLRPNQALKQNDFLIAVNTSLDFDPEKKDYNFQILEYPDKIPVIRYPWDIFSINYDQIRADFELLTKGRKSENLSATNKTIGDFPVFVETGAKAECSVFNTTEGPVYIGREAEIMEGCLIRGPFSLGEHSTLRMGARIYTGTSIGPHCKVGGEVSNSVFFGYSNKAHEGFLGNSVIAEWCNIGADTNNSNLKNTYEEVKVWNYPQRSFIKTGLTFCGLFMADHSKCGINTMFNTGTVVGVSANIFGSGFPRNFIPSFSWGGPSGMTTFKLNKAMETARMMMSRRNIEFTEADSRIFEEVFNQSLEYLNQ